MSYYENNKFLKRTCHSLANTCWGGGKGEAPCGAYGGLQKLAR